jgi:glycosyltransferase involved in cell wall biosynthesis
MLISVIIPTFNRAAKLVRAVDSVLAQTHTRLELIVVDDGSSDRTGDLLRAYRDPRLRVLQQPNRGVSAARNAGIAASGGECVALLDSDDEWLERKLERQAVFLQQGRWSVVQTDEQWIRHGRRVNPGKRHRKRAGWLFAPSLEMCLVSPSCVLFTRRWWEEIGPFDPGLPACEDYDLWLRCSLRYPIGLLPERLVRKYGGHGDQLSRRMIGLDLYRIYSLVKLLRSRYPDAEQRSLAAQHLDKRAQRYIQGCLKRGKTVEAERIRDYVADWLPQAGRLG